MEPSFDFNLHREQSVEKYKQLRPVYEVFSKTVEGILQHVLKTESINFHSIEFRAKDLESFGKKAMTPSNESMDRPKYSDPLSQITDLAGTRVITFFPKTIEKICQIIEQQFEMIEKVDKNEELIKQEKVGYNSIHYVVKLKPSRTNLAEYQRFKDLVVEIQVRTILQHAWAEIEHDIQYKSAEAIPSLIKSRFMSLAGLLEIADREFQAIQDADKKLTESARESVKQGNLGNVEITPDALKAYADKVLGPDARMSNFSYEFTVKILKELGFLNFKQIDECIRPYLDKDIDKIIYGTRQGQLWRFEALLLASLGDHYIQKHLWNKESWFVDMCNRHVSVLKNKGLTMGNYVPKKVQ